MPLERTQLPLRSLELVEKYGVSLLREPPSRHYVRPGSYAAREVGFGGVLLKVDGCLSV
jgi:hypothetical protein